MSVVIYLSYSQFPRQTFGHRESVGQKNDANVTLAAEVVTDCSGNFR